MAEPRDLTSILDVLLAEQVSFVLVGALAAVAQGAPLMTQDMDIVHARTPENLDRLMTALGKMNARYRGRSVDQALLPDSRALATTGHSLLMTDLGPLGCLGTIEGERDSISWSHCQWEVGLDGRRLRVLGLETIVAIKRASQHQKDRLALPVLEATLARRGPAGGDIRSHGSSNSPRARHSHRPAWRLLPILIAKLSFVTVVTAGASALPPS